MELWDRVIWDNIIWDMAIWDKEMSDKEIFTWQCPAKYNLYDQ